MLRVLTFLLPLSAIFAQDLSKSISVEIFKSIRSEVVRAAAYGQRLNACTNRATAADTVIRTIEKEAQDFVDQIPTLTARKRAIASQALSGPEVLRPKALQDLQSVEREIAEANATRDSKERRLTQQLRAAQQTKNQAQQCFDEANRELQKIIDDAALGKPAAQK